MMEQFNRDDEENQIVILPTGSGKSLCFLIPAILCKNITIIIYPLLALMNDQKTKLQKAGIDCVDIRGGQSADERNLIFQKLARGTKIVITNPETLNQNYIIEHLKKYRIELLIVDEAHVISQWGKSFRPAYSELRESVKKLSPHQILAFTATATEQTLADIKSCLFIKEPIVVQADADRDNIFYSSYPVFSKLEGLVEILRFCESPVIVFCGQRKSTYEIAMQVRRFFPDYPVRYYHAGLSKEERTAVEIWFKNTDKAVLITTSAYGLGVDLPGIRTVIHYDLPEDALEYLQESGRAGRDRKPAAAWVLVPQYEENPEGLMKIFKSDVCRRQALLECLGETKEECSGCDVCTKKVIKNAYGYSEIMSFVKRYPFMYTQKAVTGILSADPFFSKYRMHPFYGLLNMDGLLLYETIKLMNIPSVEIGKRGNVLYYNSKINDFIARIFKRHKKRP